MDLENMSEHDLKVLHDRVSDRLGWFPMLIVSVYDVRDFCREQIENEEWAADEMPTDDEIKAALGKVWRHYEDGSWFTCREWAVDYARESCLERLGKSVTVLTA